MSTSSSGNQQLIIGVPVVKIGNEYYISPHFGRAPYFAFIEVSGNSYKIREVVENLHAGHEHGKGRGIVELLASRNVNSVIVLGIGYGAFYMIKELGIKAYYIPAQEANRRLIPLSKAIEMFMNNQLEEAAEPREYD